MQKPLAAASTLKMPITMIASTPRSPPRSAAHATPSLNPVQIAAAWFAQVAARSLGAMPLEKNLPEQPLAVLAAFAAVALAAGRTVVILTPDDEDLPEISNALDLAIRPLCLVLPGADFATRIALRATLSLLNSRLVRDGDDEQSPAWTRQRQSIADKHALWQDAQVWLNKNDRSDWPENVAELFPARILPIAAYRRLTRQTADITLLYRCDAPVELLVSGQLLHVGACARPLPRHELAPNNAELRLQKELSQLTQDVAELELELTTAQAEMTEFTRNYYDAIGNRLVELDSLQADLARRQAESAPNDAEAHREAQQQQQRAEQSAQESRRFKAANADEPASFRPKDHVKKMFRQLAQKIHPDRAENEADRAWRTHLMSEANRAYRAGDETALRELATLWEEGRRDANATAQNAPNAPPAVPTVSPAPTLQRKVDRLRSRLSEIQNELHRLFGSRLYELFVAVRQARRYGRDLLAEMASKLDASIEQLRRQLAPAD